MATTMSVSEARAALPAVLDRVEEGDEVTITRHGRPVAVVVRIDALRARRATGAAADAERVRDLLERGRKTSLRTAPGIAAARADELVDDVRRHRSRR
jgi:prevent-host-death family protein